MEQTFKTLAILLPLGQSTDRAHSQNERIHVNNWVNGKEVLKSILTNT